ncbi:RHS repeat domain-containing protein, partial [Pseudomonas syringae group genomosp. 7]|uniref:RHS repeat domain-containing protein n=1 Tax=Pseudomonas syringae group genomosp. 7 TaxID=251699 RepID=UPI0011C441B4
IEKVVGIVRWQTFTYDCENRLVKTETMADTQVESTSSYQYDSLGRRVAKQSEIKGRTEHKRFLWQGLRMLREESPGQSSLYIYEPGSYAPLARVDEKEGEVENKVYYFHTDQIGTPLEMTDAEGQIVWQAKYRAWGAVEKLVVNEVEQNLRFQGQYFDAETGLHYNTFRYYDPEIGRFTTQDPIGLAGGLNFYTYGPNPLTYIDPWGWTGTYIFTDGTTSYIGKGPIVRANRSMAARINGSANATQFAHADFGDSKLGFMVEHRLMEKYDARASNAFANDPVRNSPGKKLYEAADIKTQRKVNRLANSLDKKFKASVGCG